MSWITPVYDRTSDEAAYAAKLTGKGDYDYLNDYMAYFGEGELGEDIALTTNQEIVDYDAGLKGSLSVSDLERIEGDIKVLADDLGLEVTTYAAIPITPTVKFYRSIVNAVQAIYDKYHTTRTPTPPAEPLNTYDKWNDIEEILDIVHEWNANRYFPRAGTDTYCGEGGILL